MSAVLHISDTHFGTQRPQVVEALLAFAQQQQPNAVVLSGDITQRALPAEFRAAKAFTDKLGAPVLAIPGNHDIPLFDLWARLTQPYARYAAAFGNDLEPVMSLPNLLLIGVNTTRAWRHKNGDVSAAQIDRVSQRLAQSNPEQLRMVVVHQPAAVTQPGDRVNLLRGHLQATRAWAAAGADLVMGGHIHLPFTLALQGLARQMWVVQAGTAVSTRTRPDVPNSVNLLRWRNVPRALAEATAERSPGQTNPQTNAQLEAQPLCVIERWDFSSADQAFVRAQVTCVQPERNSTRR